MQRVVFALGACAGLTAVGMASLAAHGLDGLGAARLQQVRSALQMHGWHALALLATAAWMPRGGRLSAAAGVCFAAGLLVFCGSVYALAIAGLRLPLLPPIGGTVLMAGWLLLAVGAVRG